MQMFDTANIDSLKKNIENVKVRVAQGLQTS
jgi:hypothetical protein